MPLNYETPPNFDREPPQWWVLAVAITVMIGVLVLMWRFMLQL